MEEKSNTESESQLGRGLRKKIVSYRISKENDISDSSNSSSSNKISDCDSIPELNENLHQQDNDINQNIDDNDTQILDINEIPIVIQAEDSNIIPAKDVIPIHNHTTGTLNSILRNVLEIKLMCRRIDERFNILENNNNNINIHRNNNLLPPLLMDCLEDINNFETILVSEEAQLQLVNILTMTGGTTEKDAMKRALQKLFTNNLATKCFWTRAKQNFTLKDLKLIMCMKNAIKKTCSTITEAQFEEILKAWFRQSNLWLNRQNNKNKNKNNTEENNKNNKNENANDTVGNDVVH
ncbi:rho GTPase-activating protein gacU-like [Nylanderia fulva]|uniref:rho GTPase-activating protein gacU-like n=1 Tax=Nylanderia fulva TaxID=613905 RepID=UPI0010FB1E6D|nr:rho GTPase-activating protein gacU-like [Nylanderia fulva]